MDEEDKKVDVMAENFREIISRLGEDVNREGLVDTPQRAAKAMHFLTRGYRQNLDELINKAVFTSDTDEMVIVRNIEMYSLCEHHMLPFIGKCHVAYLPQGKVLGLSKIARIVDYFARRLQIQEVLTKQVAESVFKAIDARGVGVVIEAQHMCMMMRGVEKQNSVMTTSCMLGAFREHADHPRGIPAPDARLNRRGANAARVASDSADRRRPSPAPVRRCGR